MLLLQEKRAEKRLQVNLPVTYSFVVGNDTITGNSSTTNLSDSGLCFYADMPLKMGLRLRILLNDIWDDSKECQVRWCIKQHNQYRIGVAF